MKILILTQNLVNRELETLRQGVAQVNKLLPQLEFFYQTTSKKYSSIPVNNGLVNGYVLNNQEILQDVSGDFDIACLVFNWSNITPQPTNPSCGRIMKGNCIPMSIPKQWYVGYSEVFCQYFLHELCHAEFFRANKQDITDNTALFYASEYTQFSPYYVNLLKKIWDNGRLATLTRYKDTGKETLGKLVCQNGGAKFTCDTLELSWKGNQKNISSIPTGMYTCKYTFSPKFMKWTYEVQKVYNRSGIRLHSGNFAKSDTNGCILLGKGYNDIDKDGIQDLLNSRINIKALEGFMNKKEFILVIK